VKTVLSILGLVALPPLLSADSFDYTGSLQTYTVAQTGVYQIAAYGGARGSGNYGVAAGGLGAEIGGDFALTAGQVVNIYVGQQGDNGGRFGGGGGCDFGGGYSGGDGSTGGYGGGSYLDASVLAGTQILISGASTGDGLVDITPQFSAVPEPGTWALLLLGCATVVLVLWRRRAGS
jgi:hypothetical protein